MSEVMSNDDLMISMFMNIVHSKVPPKKKYFLKLMKRVNPSAANGIVARILQSNDFKAEFDRSILDILDFERTRDKYASEGYHGFLIVDRMIIPAKLEVETEEDWVWARENEKQVSVTVAHGGMNVLGLDSIHCTVVLFSQFGFSGLNHDWPLIRMADDEGNDGFVRYGETNYFFQDKAVK